MTSISALPAITAQPATSTVSRAKALVASNALAVTAIRSIPDETRRQELRQANQSTDQETTALTSQTTDVAADRVSERVALRSQAQSQSTATGGNTDAAAANSQQTTTTASTVTAATATKAGPSTAFLAQSLYQENLGSGLYIEPWSDALSAYRRADSLNTPSSNRSIDV